MMVLRIGLLSALISLWFSVGSSQSISELPTISQHPESIILPSDGSTTLGCLATSSTPLTYAWLRNGYLIEGADSNSYVVTIAINGTGEYNCLASNVAGIVSSQTAAVQEAVISDSFFSNSVDSPRQITAVQGDPMMVSCGEYSSVPSARLTWSIWENIALQIDDRVVYGLDGTLYLQDPNSFNNEIFECSAQNSVSREFVSGFVQISVQVTNDPPHLPEITIAPQDTTVSVGEDAFFECIAGGAPVPVVTWDFPDGVTVRFSQNNNVITVRDVSPSDAGTYRCSATSVAGSFPAVLTVEEAPVISDPLPSDLMTVTYGDPLSLACVSSSPGDWQWYFNGRKLIGETLSSFSLHKTVLDNAGVYQCFITNRAGFASSEAIVEVMTTPVSIATPLTTPQLAFREQSFSLLCNASGAPPPSYIWTKESIPLADSDSFRLTSEGSLTIVNVDTTSDGNYTCLASNNVGDLVIGTASTSAIIVTIEPTVLVQEPGPIFIVQVDTLGSLVCEAESDPTVDIVYSWTRDGLPLVVAGRFSQDLTTGTITITQAMMSDAGLYVCTITTTKNGIMGPVVQSTPTNLTITETPVAPMIIAVTAQGPNSLEVQWHFPGSARELSEYSIEYQLSGATIWMVHSTQPASATTVATINNLTPYMEYSVRIVAKYREGIFPETLSEVVGQRTLSDIPGDAPSAVSAVAVSTTELRFSWTAPQQPNGLIVDYVVKYRVEREAGDLSQALVMSGTATSFLLGDLRPIERYEYCVAALTSAGEGPCSPLQTADTIDTTITEPTEGPFYSQIWFIVVMVVLTLIIIAVIFGITVLAVRLTSHRTKTTYHVGDAQEQPDMSSEAFQAYSERSRRKDIELKMYHTNTAVEFDDQDSNFVDSAAYTPQLSESSRTNLVHGRPSAPGYIHPPTFEEALNRPRSQSMHSRHSSIGEKPPMDYWDENSKSGLIDEPLSDLDDEQGKRDYHVGYRPASRQESFRQALEYTGYDLDDDSIGKPSFASSEVTDATEYSHLQSREQGYSHLNTPTAASNHATFV